MKAITTLTGMLLALAICMPGVAQQKKHVQPGAVITHQYFSKLNAEVSWQLVDSVRLNFTTYHTQGLTKVGDFYFLSAVKVNRWPKKYTSVQNGFDRDQGDGVGYLFKLNLDGTLADSIRLGKGAIYHPGGIDFDGSAIWVPVCEYRPFGKSIVYRVQPETMQAAEITTLSDAIGAVAYNRQTNELTGMNFGSRVFYKWQINRNASGTHGRLLNPKGHINPHFYVDYQDCNYAGAGKMICSGLRAYKNANGETIRLGGLELIDMKQYEAGLQLPVNLYTSKGTVVTNNPFYIELVKGALQCYFVPEDDASVLYIYRLQQTAP